MFKKKEYIILLGIIVILSFVILKNKNDNISYKLPNLKKIDKKLIDKIEIENSKGKIILILKDKRWELSPEGYPANKYKLEKMIELITETDISDLSSRAKQYEKYGLGLKDRIIIIGKNNNKILRKLIIGNKLDIGNRTFMRLPDDEFIYQARGNYKLPFDIVKNDIIEKKIYNFNKDDIIALSIIKDGEKNEFEKRPEKKKDDKEKIKDKEKPKNDKFIWENIADVGKVNAKEIDSYISKNANLRCQSFVNYSLSSLKNEYLAIKFKDKSGKAYTLKFYKPKEDKDETILISNTSKFPFKISDDDISKLIIDFKKLKTAKK